MLWQSVFLVEETWVPGENHRPVTSHWPTLSQSCIEYTSGFKLTTLVSIGTDCAGSCKSSFHMQGDSGKEVALWRLTSLSHWSKAKFKSSCNFEESPYVAACVFSPFMKMSTSCTCLLISIVSVILKVIFLESNPLLFIETLISFIRGFVYTCPPYNKTICFCFS
jgi:hypothetical protein